METWLDPLVQGLAEWPPSLAYAALAASAFLENVVPPIPGDTVVVFSAYLVGRGVLSWIPVYGATCFGGTIGFLTMYWLGATQGRDFLLGHRARSRAFPLARIERAEAWLHRFGPWLVLANRFLTGVRSAIALAAGLAHLGWRRVAMLSLASMMLWNGLLLCVGIALGENWASVGPILGRYQKWVLVAVCAVVAAVLLRRRYGPQRPSPSRDIDRPRERL